VGIIGIALEDKFAVESKTMALWQNVVEIETITDLKDFTPATDGDKRLVKSIDTIPTGSAWYRYDIASTFPELLPAIVTPNSGDGRWIMINPVVYSYNSPSDPPPLNDIRWVKIDDEIEWTSKYIDDELIWTTESLPTPFPLVLTSEVFNSNGMVALGCNGIEVLCLSGTAVFNDIPLTATGLVNGFRFPILNNNQIYDNLSYTVSGELLINEYRFTSPLTSPQLVTVTSEVLTDVTDSTANNALWVSCLLLDGTADFDNIPLSTDIMGYELKYKQDKLYSPVTYTVDILSEILLITATNV
jgi:hypothetical protein